MTRADALVRHDPVGIPRLAPSDAGTSASRSLSERTGTVVGARMRRWTPACGRASTVPIGTPRGGRGTGPAHAAPKVDQRPVGQAGPAGIEPSGCLRPDLGCADSSARSGTQLSRMPQCIEASRPVAVRPVAVGQSSCVVHLCPWTETPTPVQTRLVGDGSTYRRRVFVEDARGDGSYLRATWHPDRRARPSW